MDAYPNLWYEGVYFVWQGSGVRSSEALQGMVFKRQVEGDVTKKFQAKVAVYTCAVDTMQTETKVRACQFIVVDTPRC